MQSLRPTRQLHSGGRWFHGAPVQHVDWDPRGRRLLSKSASAVRIWWSATGELVGSLPGIDADTIAFGNFFFLADGRRIAGCTHRDNKPTLRLWDVEELALAGEISPGSGDIVTIDRERRLAITYSSYDNDVSLVDLESGVRVASFYTSEASALIPESVEIMAAAIHPDGKRVFLHRQNTVSETPGAYIKETFEIWDVATSELLKVSRSSTETTSACWDASGRRLVVGGEGATILDGETLQPLGRLDQVPGYTPYLYDFGPRIAAAHGRLARFYSAAELTPDARYVPTAGPSLALAPDGVRLLSGGDGGVLLVTDLASGKPVGEERELPQAEHFSGVADRTVSITRDGRTLAVGMGTSVAFHDGETLELQRKIEWVKATAADHALFRAADPNATADGSLAAAFWPYDRNRDGEPHGVLVFGPRGAMFDLRHQITDGRAGPVAVAPDGVLAASGHSTTTMRLWELATALERRALNVPAGEPAESIRAVAFSPDGTLVAAGDARGSVHVWRTADGERIARHSVGGGHPVTALAFGPRGLLAAGRAAERGNLVVLGAEGNFLATLSGHASDVVSLAFHPDGKRLLSAGRDRCVFAWDVP